MLLGPLAHFFGLREIHVTHGDDPTIVPAGQGAIVTVTNETIADECDIQEIVGRTTALTTHDAGERKGGRGERGSFYEIATGKRGGHRSLR